MRTPAISRLVRRWVATPLLWTTAFLMPPLLVAVGNVALKMRALSDAPPPPPLSLPLPPTHDRSKPTAVVLLANAPTEATDFLAPYEVLARSGAYDVYALAPERRPVPLFPGELDVLPHMSFAEYEERIGTRPAVIVVPYMEFRGQGVDPRITSWIQERWRDGTILLTICGGSYVVAQGGLLDGRRATSHTNVLRIVTSELPRVSWVQGSRWVDDGDLITSGGITAGVDATLYLIGRELGRAHAERVAAEVGYPHTGFLDDPGYVVPAAGTAATYLRALYDGFSDVGLILYDGASEIALGALTDTYPRSYVSRLRPLAPERGYVRTRHGLQMIPRWGFDDAPGLDRVMVAGEPTAPQRDVLVSWATARGLDAVPVPRSGYAYDNALLDVAARYSPAVALDVARGIEYPTAHLPLPASGLPLTSLMRPLMLAFAGVVLLFALRSFSRRRRPNSPGRSAAAVHGPTLDETGSYAI